MEEVELEVPQQVAADRVRSSGSKADSTRLGRWNRRGNNWDLILDQRYPALWDWPGKDCMGRSLCWVGAAPLVQG